MAAPLRRVTLDNWVEQLQYFMVGNHPSGDNADDLDILLNDMEDLLTFSVRGQRTLQRAKDYTHRLRTDYRALDENLEGHEAALERLRRLQTEVIDFTDSIAWREGFIQMNLEPFQELRQTIIEEIDGLTHTIWLMQSQKKEYQTSWEDLIPQLDDLVEEEPYLRRR